MFSSGGAMCLAIGDGANDVSMIQEADVGIGISGKEGLQAVQASDYAIAQFRFLSRLLLVHGRWAYVRTSELILNYFYKNVMWLFVLFLYQFDSGFTGDVIMDFTYGMFFQTVFTLLPNMLMGMLDQDVNDRISMQVPGLYSKGIRQSLYNMERFWMYIFDAMYQSVIAYYFAVYLFAEGTVDPRGYTIDKSFMGTGLAFFCIITVNIYMGLNNFSWTWLTLASVILSIIAFTAYVFIYAATPESPTFGQTGLLFTQPAFYLSILVTVVLALIPRILFKFVQQVFFPNDTDIIQEYQKYHWKPGQTVHMDAEVGGVSTAGPTGSMTFGTGTGTGSATASFMLHVDKTPDAHESVAATSMMDPPKVILEEEDGEKATPAPFESGSSAKNAVSPLKRTVTDTALVAQAGPGAAGSDKAAIPGVGVASNNVTEKWSVSPRDQSPIAPAVAGETVPPSAPGPVIDVVAAAKTDVVLRRTKSDSQLSPTSPHRVLANAAGKSIEVGTERKEESKEAQEDSSGSKRLSISAAAKTEKDETSTAPGVAVASSSSLGWGSSKMRRKSFMSRRSSTSAVGGGAAGILAGIQTNLLGAVSGGLRSAPTGQMPQSATTPQTPTPTSATFPFAGRGGILGGRMRARPAAITTPTSAGGPSSSSAGIGGGLSSSLNGGHRTSISGTMAIMGRRAGEFVKSVPKRLRIPSMTPGPRIDKGLKATSLVFMGTNQEMPNTGFCFSHEEGMEDVITPLRNEMPFSQLGIDESALGSSSQAGSEIQPTPGTPDIAVIPSSPRQPSRPGSFVSSSTSTPATSKAKTPSSVKWAPRFWASQTTPSSDQSPGGSGRVGGDSDGDQVQKQQLERTTVDAAGSPSMLGLPPLAPSASSSTPSSFVATAASMLNDPQSPVTTNAELFELQEDVGSSR
ncbi:hypothetical protein HK102_003011 [Quaeritorhiza haematococci]|nr:hypothetical protein HK102_003011 [Quaeritorhiza haematococci]